MTRATHWNSIYTNLPPQRVSWFQPHLALSLELLERASLSRSTRIIDVGAGASTLIDDLLDCGVQAVTALDISAAALQVARERLHERSERVRWIVSDVTELDLPPSSIDIWHDRATLHFLTDPQDAAKYIEVASHVVAPGGYALIGGFANDGPEQCSGLPVVRRDPEEIAQLFAKEFELLEARRETHRTPGGTAQNFAYALLRKRTSQL